MHLLTTQQLALLKLHTTPETMTSHMHNGAATLGTVAETIWTPWLHDQLYMFCQHCCTAGRACGAGEVQAFCGRSNQGAVECTDHLVFATLHLTDNLVQRPVTCEMALVVVRLSVESLVELSSAVQGLRMAIGCQGNGLRVLSCACVG